MKNTPLNNDVIAALSTPPGMGAIAVIRVSGKDTFAVCSHIFRKKKKAATNVSKLASHTVHFGEIYFQSTIIDEVLLTVFKAPHSYTGEDTVEISCHGSTFIQEQILHLLLRNGARFANAGEFTFRAFMNGKFDLSQAEAVADLIASHSSTSHDLAMKQMRGGFSDKINVLREKLIDFASLIELELDFSEEDVEFAKKEELKKLVESLQAIISKLIRSFELGNVIKNGIPVCIVGRPNSGKSTLLNALLNEERAIVSEIPGTTRDTIEDEMVIEGVRFRFIDTAGIRHTSDRIESAGIERTFKAVKQSSIVIYLFDTHEFSLSDLEKDIDSIKDNSRHAELILVGNKIDKEEIEYTEKEFASIDNIVFISAREKKGLEDLKIKLVRIFDKQAARMPETIITNTRHVEALNGALAALEKVHEGIGHNQSGELLASDIRNALHYLGLITGKVSTEDLLKNIFGKFCIGK